MFLRLKISGKDNVPKTGGFIVASNHVSYLDPVVVGCHCPRKLNYMARHDLFDIPLLGFILSHVDAFPVKRGSADLGAIRKALRRVEQGGGLLVFPEGRRVPGGLQEEPEPGIGFLISKLNVPVVPVYVKGTDKALPKHSKVIRFSTVSVRFGKQITFERGLPYQDIARSVMEHIRRLS